MARKLSWSDVRGGVLALGVILAAAFGVLKFFRVGALHGDTVRVYALVGEARALAAGSEVWLSGQKIGKVARITFQPVTVDTSRRILVEMQLLARYRDAVHTDATAQIRSGGTIIGAVVVYLTPGTARTRAIADGDTVVARPQADVEGATAGFSRAARELPAIMANVRSVQSELQATRGTAGALMNAPGLSALAETRVRSVRVMNRLHAGGTVGLVMQGGLSVRAGHVLARVDSVRALVGSSRTTFGRLRRDSTLLGDVADIRAELARVQASLDEPRGTAGRVLHDSALTRSLAAAQAEMALLFADLKKHPFRYLSF